MEAIGGRRGASQPAIEKYILSNYPEFHYVRATLRNTLKRNVENGRLAYHHIHTSSFKKGPRFDGRPRSHTTRAMGRMRRKAATRPGSTRRATDRGVDRRLKAARSQYKASARRAGRGARTPQRRTGSRSR